MKNELEQIYWKKVGQNLYMVEVCFKWQINTWHYA